MILKDKTKNKKRLNKKLLILLIIITVITQTINWSEALVFSPKTQEIKTYYEPQDIIVTAINDEAKPRQLLLTPDYYSFYLKDYFTITPETTILEPGETRNIKAHLELPEKLSPQKHTIKILSGPGSDEYFKIEFTPPGKPRPELKIISAKPEKKEVEDAIIITLDFRNNGNVYLLARPILRIINTSGTIIKTNYPRPIMIQPGKQESISIRQELTTIKPGNYEAIISINYTYSEEAETKTTEEQIISFTKKTTEEEKQKNNWWIWSIIA